MQRLKDIKVRIEDRFTHLRLNSQQLNKPYLAATPSMAGSSEASLLSTQKFDSTLQVALHPLVLLSVSDYITRHTLRSQKGPIIGAILGQQNGQELTAEHAYECKVIDGEIDLEWFDTRLQQMKDVHKAPALDLVGWYTLVPASGPLLYHLNVHKQLAANYPESTILLGIHTSQILDESAGGKLPLSVYEVGVETLDNNSNNREDVEMVDEQSSLREVFHEVPYYVETGEAEMISMDFVAKGGGNASAVEPPQQAAAPTEKAKGKKRAADAATRETATRDADPDDKHVTNAAEDELIAFLTAKANAIRMLKARIDLLRKYVDLIPSDFGPGTTIAAGPNGESVPLNHGVLRSVMALLNRLLLVVPANSKAFTEELLAEQNDANMVQLLDLMTESIQLTKELGRKNAIVEGGRTVSRKRAGFQRSGVDNELPSFDRGNSGVFGVGDLAGR